MRFRKALFLASAVFLPLFVGATSPQLVEKVRIAVTVTANPFLDFQEHTTRFIQSQIHSLVEWPTIRKKAAVLERELEHLRGDIASLSELKQENERLGALLNLKGSRFPSAIAARVIARDPSHWSQFIIINKGMKDGIRVDMALIDPHGLVGRVVAAGPHSARAILLTDRQSRVSALNERTRDAGLVEGTGGFMLKMTYLDPNSKLEVGDQIVSSGLGGIYTKGILIGRVEIVGEEKNHLTLYALVEPFVSFSKLEEVLCVFSPANG